MTDYERIQALTIVVALLCLTVVGLSWRVLVLFRYVAEDQAAIAAYRAETDDRITELETQWLRFSSPDAIVDDMERTADIIEARQAGRQAMPRPGSTPHARIRQTTDPRSGNGWDQKSKNQRG